MAASDTADLALLALAGDNPGESTDSCSVVQLAERLEMGTDTMADRIALLSALSELEDRDLVEQRADGYGTEYSLTERGTTTAAELYDSVADRPIQVRNGTTEQLTLADVDEYLSTPAVARALSRLTDDGILYLEEDVETGFIDRSEELAAVDEHLAAVREGEGRLLLVTGDPGVGKTTFVQHAFEGCSDATVLESVARAETDEPYHSIREALDPVLAETPFDRPPMDLEDPDRLEHLRTALFADVADALFEHSTDDPIVLVIDDLQNAGEPTLELLAFLAGRISDGRVLLVAISRPDALGDAVHEVADVVRHEHNHGHIRLDPFDRDRTEALIAASLGTRRIPAEFVDLVYEQTGGTPLFVTELLAEWRERNHLVPEHDVFPADASTVPITETVEETIQTRLENLDETGERILQTAALLGEEFAIETLLSATDVDRGVVLEYLSVLEDVSIVTVRRREGEETLGRVWFNSGLFRETVVAGIPDDRRKAYHREIASTLAVQSGDQSMETAATIAYHYQETGADRRALQAWLRAGEHAEAVYAQETARNHYQQALEIARRLEQLPADETATGSEDTGVDAVDECQIVDILETLGEINYLLADHEDARRAFEYVRAESDDLAQKQRAAHKIGLQEAIWKRDPEAALAAAESGLALSNHGDATEEATGDGTEEATGDGTERESTGETGSAGESANEPFNSAVGRLLVLKGKSLGHLGRFEEAYPVFERAIELARRYDDPATEGKALRSFVAWQAFQRNVVDDDIVEQGQRAVEIFETLGDDFQLGVAHNALAVVYSMLGDVDAAERSSRNAVEQFRLVGDRLNAVANEHNLAGTATLRCLNGEQSLEDVRRHVDDVLEEARAIDHTGLELGTLLLGCRLDWLCAYDHRSAVEQAERAYDLAGENEEMRELLEAVTTLSGVLESAGWPKRARPYVEEAVELGREAQIPTMASYALVLQGRLALDDDSPATAIESFEAAVRIAVEGDHRQAEVFARGGLIDGLLSVDQTTAAVDEAEAIETRLDEDGAAVTAVTEFQAMAKPAIVAHRAIGRAIRAWGQHDAAVTAFERGLDRAREQNDVYRETICLFEVAETKYETGEFEDAREYLERARANLPELGTLGRALDRRFETLRKALT